MGDFFGTSASKPRQQYYGGSSAQEAQYRDRNLQQQGIGTAQEVEGLGKLSAERSAAQERYARNAGAQQQERDREAVAADRVLGYAFNERELSNARTAALSNIAGTERIQAQQAYGQLAGQNQNLAAQALDQGGAYGLGADAALGNYAAGRGSQLQSADQLEGYAQGAAAEYQSGADRAFQAAAARNQRNAMGLAAGRGANALRTALATSSANNAQAGLDQQVVRAQEANQLNAMRNQAVTSAAGIRSGVGAQDQSAAGLQAQRQQAALGLASGYQAQNAGLVQANNAAGQQAVAQQAQLVGQDAQLGLGLGNLRAGVVQNSAQYGLQSNALKGQLAAQDSQLGFANAGARTQSGQTLRQDYLGAETAGETAALGADIQSELQRQQWAKENSAASKAGKIWGYIKEPSLLLG